MDLTGFESEGDKKAFLLAFARRLYLKNENPLHLFLEEADDYCLTPDTEVLTTHGWATWDSLRVGTEVACFDPTTGQYSFGPVQRVLTRVHDGPMVGIRTRAIDCLMTPDHRAVIGRNQHNSNRSKKRYDWAFCAASKLPSGGFRVPLGGAPCGPGLECSEAFLRVMGWVITDGHFHDRRKSEVLCVAQSTSTKKRGRSVVADMDDLLLECEGVRRYDRPARVTKGVRGEALKGAPAVSWYLGRELSMLLMAHLRDAGIHRIPRAVISLASRRQLEALWLGLLEGDGTSQRKGQWTCFYAGDNEGLADDFQELCLRIGVSAVKSRVPHPPHKDQWYVHIAKRSQHWVRKPTVERYTGMVWDITVPTGAFVARRNGRPFVTGNCPQRPMRDEAQLLRAWENIVRRGRARGLGVTLITQRSAAINKAVLTQVETLFVLRTTGPQDIAAIEAWVQYHQVDKSLLRSLAGLENGEAWVWSPHYLKRFDRVRIRRRRTFDTGATPKNLKGTDARPVATLADVDLTALRTKLASAIEQAKADDPRELRKRIHALERQIAGHVCSNRVEKPEVVEKPVIPEAVRASARAVDVSLMQFHRTLTDLIAQHYQDLERELRTLFGLMAAVANQPPARSPIQARLAHARTLLTGGRALRALNPEPRTLNQNRRQKAEGRSEKLPPGEHAVLTAALQYPDGLDRKRLGILTGYKRSSRDAYIVRLAQKGLVSTTGGALYATDAGRAALNGSFEPLPVGEALIAYWRQRLPEGERKTLDVLLEAGGQDVPRERIDAVTGYRRSSRDAYLTRLKARGLVDVAGPGTVRAAAALFEEA